MVIYPEPGLIHRQGTVVFDTSSSVVLRLCYLYSFEFCPRSNTDWNDFPYLLKNESSSGSHCHILSLLHLLDIYFQILIYYGIIYYRVIIYTLVIVAVIKYFLGVLSTLYRLSQLVLVTTIWGTIFLFLWIRELRLRDAWSLLKGHTYL